MNKNNNKNLDHLFAERGFLLLENFMPPQVVEEINAELQFIQPGSRKGGLRGINKKIHSIGSWLSSCDFMMQASVFFRRDFKVQRAILFDKNPKNNWSVTWHQDKTVVVDRRFEAFGWGPWSVKEGEYHVQAPVDVLNRMVTFRIHLDNATEKNGCLRVIPASHKFGVLAWEEIQCLVRKSIVEECKANVGVALVMRPLLVHSSQKMRAVCSRRVLHVECVESESFLSQPKEPGRLSV